MLLGEKLIAFRDASGKVGVMDHRCPHRCASLFYRPQRRRRHRLRLSRLEVRRRRHLPATAEPAARAGVQGQGPRQRPIKVQRAGGPDLGLHGRARAGPADAGDRGGVAAGIGSQHQLHPTRVQLVAGAGRRHRHLAFQLAACRQREAGAGAGRQLGQIPGGASRAGLSGDGYRLGHDVLRHASGRGRRDLLAVRAFRAFRSGRSSRRARSSIA